MTDSPSHHDDWFQPDVSMRPVDGPALLPGNALRAAPSLRPVAPEPADPSLGLKGLAASAMSNEPSLGFSHAPDLGVAVIDGAPVAGPADHPLDRVSTALGAVPIERVAPVMALAFGCSILFYLLVQALF